MEELDFDEMFASMLGYLYEITVSVIPGIEWTDMFISGTQNRREMHICFNAMEQQHVGLFLGRKKRNLNMIFAWLRAQQVCPGDKYIYLTISTPDGRIQKFKDSNLFKYDKVAPSNDSEKPIEEDE